MGNYAILVKSLQMSCTLHVAEVNLVGVLEVNLVGVLLHWDHHYVVFLGKTLNFNMIDWHPIWRKCQYSGSLCATGLAFNIVGQFQV